MGLASQMSDVGGKSEMLFRTYSTIRVPIKGFFVHLVFSLLVKMQYRSKLKKKLLLLILGPVMLVDCNRIKLSEDDDHPSHVLSRWSENCLIRAIVVGHDRTIFRVLTS
jgi:hypothetical protein